MKRIAWFLVVLLIGFSLNEYLHQRGFTLPRFFQRSESKYYRKAPSEPLGTPSAPGNPNFISEAAKKAVKAVVNIDTIFRTKSPFSEFFGNDPALRQFFDFPLEPIPQKGMGSGFIIKESGLVLTNEHVIHAAKTITVTLADKRSFPAKVIGKDQRLDVAVLKIAGDHLPVLPLGDSKRLQLGDWVLAIGNPFGIGHTVTSGIVSALHRKLQHPESGELLENLIQTDAAINRGNSGGPLVNLEGEAVGVNTAIFSPSGGSVGIGFAIAIDDIKKVLGQLIEKGKVTWPARPWIGVRIGLVANLPSDCPKPKSSRGAYVAQVLPKTPAAKAGLLRCDVVLKIDSEPVMNPDDVVEKIRKKKVGDRVHLTIWRDKETLTKVLLLAPLPERELRRR